MQRISALFAVAVAMVVVGCGSSDDSTEVFAHLQARLAETAYVPSYQRCVITEAERLLTPAELRGLDGLSQEQASKAGFNILEPATIKCREDARGPIIDPKATSAELAPIKDLSAKEFALGVVEAGATRAQADCVERSFSAMSDAKVIELGNATSTRAQERLIQPILQPILRSCLGI